MVAWRTQHSLNHGQDTCALEQIHLARIFLEDLCESESFYGSLAVVVRGRLDGDVRRMTSLALFDSKETSMARGGRAQTQEDVEERARGPRWRFHGHCACQYDQPG